MERYRLILSISPNDTMALNNLAYGLAVHQPELMEEALGLARRANTVTPGNAAVLDTLAWILHLSGDDRGARTPSNAAVRLAPNAAQVLHHSAIIDAAVGAMDQATRKLERALALDPSLADSEETARLRAALAGAQHP